MTGSQSTSVTAKVELLFAGNEGSKKSDSCWLLLPKVAAVQRQTGERDTTDQSRREAARRGGSSVQVPLSIQHRLWRPRQAIWTQLGAELLLSYGGGIGLDRCSSAPSQTPITPRIVALRRTGSSLEHSDLRTFCLVSRTPQQRFEVSLPDPPMLAKADARRAALPKQPAHRVEMHSQEIGNFFDRHQVFTLHQHTFPHTPPSVPRYRRQCKTFRMYLL